LTQNSGCGIFILTRRQAAGQDGSRQGLQVREFESKEQVKEERTGGFPHEEPPVTQQQKNRTSCDAETRSRVPDEKR